MSDILLVFPRFRYPSGDPPLGVAYLAAALLHAGHSVEIFDATFEAHPLKALERRLRKTQPRLVAISALTSMLSEVAATAQLVKSVSLNIKVIVGGPHATVEPASTAALPGVDAVFVGEGEISLCKLVEADFDWQGVPGFGWLEDGQLIQNDCGPMIEDLDSLPMPAWDLLPMKKYLDIWYQLDAVAEGLRGTSIIASRGCPFNCAYCQPTLRTIFGSKIRRRSADSIIAELNELKRRYQIDGVMWLDDTFLIDNKWMSELCDKMISGHLKLLWGANVRADTADRETLERMREAGLRVVHIGIESATQRILDDIYQKQITVEQVRETVALCRELDLHVRGYFMLGAPGETEAEARATVNLACELPLDDATFSITTPLPHTHLWDKTRELVTRDLQDFDYYKMPVYGGGSVISASRLVRLKREAYLRFYLGPRLLGRTLRSFTSIQGIRKALVKLKRF